MNTTDQDQAVVREDIINGVLKEFRGVTRADMAGPSRQKKVSRARRLAIHRLHEAGLTNQQIGALFNRAGTTIYYVLHRGPPDRREEKRVYKILYSLPEDVRSVLSDLAAAEETSPQTVILEWVTERARYEAAAKARAAA